MTIIVAVPGKAGTVLASDGQVTYADGIRTTGRKIYQLNKKCLWAASGRNALIQRVQEKFLQFQEREDSLENMRDALAKIVRGCVNDLLQLDQQPPQESFVFVEHPADARILQVSVAGTPEWVTTGPFAIGIGRMFAHALLQKYESLFPANIDVDKAALLAFKIIEEAIQVGAFGLGPPIDVWRATPEGVRHLGPEEISALQDLSRGLREAELGLFLGSPGT